MLPTDYWIGWQSSFWTCKQIYMAAAGGEKLRVAIWRASCFLILPGRRSYRLDAGTRGMAMPAQFQDNDGNCIDSDDRSWNDHEAMMRC